MDLIEESREDRLIEDYLFSGYKPHNQQSTFDVDQQFARPIEDEDLFCVRDNIGSGGALDEANPAEVADDVLEPSSNQFEFDDRPFRRLSDEPLLETNVSSPGKLFEDEASDPLSSPLGQQDDILPEAPIDDIFLDDYSESGDAANTENIRPTLEKSYSKPPAAPQLTPAQVKKKLMLDRIKQQVIAMQQTRPRPSGGIGTGFGKDGTIELTLENSKLVSDSSSKFIFNKLFNNSGKANDSTGSSRSAKMDWFSYKTMLRKQICAQKRKVWNSFQAPTDAYDDEEELVGAESIGGSEKDAAETDDEQNRVDSDDDDADSNDDGEAEDEDSKSEPQSEDELNTVDSDSCGPKKTASNHESKDSDMECADESSYDSVRDSDDDIVRKKIVYSDDESDDNGGGSARKFIDDEVEVDEDLY